MREIAIEAHQLCKLYQIGNKQQANASLREQLSDIIRSPIQRAKHLFAGQTSGVAGLHKPFWALQDVSFEIKRGDVVAILGSNGAGKSTLLKILSRITEPTSGYVDIYGRVASLLEVGTGFHPELTGRENIYLNGSLLGMKKGEIEDKFDDIVEFAEIDEFIDTPVKHYSSGMYVRLAFAVAAHLEPDILLVDEVLAVGDVAFQKKCLGKMDEVSKQGRTVIFVSHNMNAVQRLCPNAILLKQGQIVTEGITSSVIAQYLAEMPSQTGPMQSIDLSTLDREGSGKVRFNTLTYQSDMASVAHKPYSDGPLEVTLNITAEVSCSIASVAVTLYDRYGTKLVNADSSALGDTIELQAGHNVLCFKIEHLHLNPGLYTVGLWAANPPSEVFDVMPNALQMEVVEMNPDSMRVSVDGAVTCKFEVLRDAQRTVLMRE